MPVLRSPYLANAAELRSIAAGGGALRTGARSLGVAQVQAALRDLGYGLTRSTGKGNAMDGFYGEETTGMVRAVQRDRALPQTGIVEAATLGAVDQYLAVKQPLTLTIKPRPGRNYSSKSAAKAAARGAKPIGPADPYPLPLWDENYEIGTSDPTVTPDPGAGGWNTKPRTFSAIAQAVAIQQMLELGTSHVIGRNATRHLKHYFANHGSDLTIDLENMIRTVPSARTVMVVEFRQALEFLRGLPPGRYDFTSRRGSGGYNRQQESTDWYFAIGGYSVWGKGRAEMTGTGANRRYDVDFTYKFFDRYNWDGGKEVEIGGIRITDEFMGEFHRQGLTKEYTCYGSLRRRLSWVGEVSAPSENLILQAGRR
ncbi:peptidoglycan-binding domain-containing protein [Sphingomonas endolithica]|uniref:peptidoglycan-binding domain-containing protein n=1 Tax=Sphingomonas endolithica TaxID=2972485 RepID=UPI0021AEF6F9|nr:peptidoglycan-binding domain-containing protein [Sphingomonas sp. ZFBP2030]